MKVLLIWPKNKDTMIGIPLGFAYLVSNTTGHSIDILDCFLDDINADDNALINKCQKYDVIGISSSSANFPEVSKIAKNIKKIYNIPIVIGGPHATLYPESVLKNPEFDYVLRGECEITFNMLLDRIFDGTIKQATISGLCYNGLIAEDIARVNDLNNLAFRGS